MEIEMVGAYNSEISFLTCLYNSILIKETKLQVLILNFKL